MQLAEYKQLDWDLVGEDWIDTELRDALDALPTNKHRTTVLRLAEATVVGRSMEETFRMQDVCSKKTWHGPHINGTQKPGWKDDSRVARAYNLALARVSKYQQAGIAANIKETGRLLAQEAPNAVMVLSTMMADDEVPDETRRKAANDILDRFRDMLTVKGGSNGITLSETRTITFDLSSVPMEMLDDIIDG